MNKSREQKERQLRKRYDAFIRTKSGQEWKELWKTRIDPDDREKEAGDFGDYLYDFHPEMLM